MQVNEDQGNSVQLPLWWRVVSLMAFAVVLRPPVAGVGPLLPEISSDLALSSAAESALASIPIVCFGLGAFLTPAFVRKFGLNLGIQLIATMLVAGIVMRSLGDLPLVFVGSTLVGIAIALGNTALPTAIKQDFPDKITVMTGSYTTVMVTMAAIAATIAVPLAGNDGTDWRTSLLWWAIPAALAWLLWLPHARHGSSAEISHARVTVWRQSAAWTVAVFMGLQSISFYAVMAWLPSVLQDSGFTPTDAGYLLGFSSFAGIPMGLVIAPILRRNEWLAPATVVVSLIAVVGTAGLAVNPASLTVLWLLLIGVGQGSAFPLALNLITLRAADRDVTTALSAVAQGGGYLIAAVGSYAFGALHGWVGNWTLPLWVLTAIAVAQTVVGWFAAQPQPIHADTVRP